MKAKKGFDVAVVGAGVFGAWTAYRLVEQGASVALIDAYGPANSRASSGGESRILRFGYGGDEVYTRSAQRSLLLWKSLFATSTNNSSAVFTTSTLFHQTGVLWLARKSDPYCQSVVQILETVGAKFEYLERDELERRYPQFNFGPVAWGILELETGILMARRAVQLLISRACEKGVTYVHDAIVPPQEDGHVASLQTRSDSDIFANQFVFACGPWLPKLFPQLLANIIHVTRQEVFFFGPPDGNTRFGPEALPAWIDFNDLAYGIPNLENRGLKIAIDAHGPEFDPDRGERVVSAEGLSNVRAFLAERMPQLAAAPVIETRVCQYENTANGDFLVDQHPEIENVWLVGGGSGHGFKHGPVVGEYVAGLLAGTDVREPRFSLATKGTIRQRKVY